MRIAWSVFILVLAVNLSSAAKDLTDWTEVQKLKTGTEVLVLDTLGNRVGGYVTSVSWDELKLDVPVASQAGLLTPEVFARTEVAEIYKVGKKFRRRLSARSTILASTVGLVAGIGIGAAVDQAHPSAEDPGQGKLVGGVLGFFLGPAALAIGRAVISGLHRTKLIYRAPTGSHDIGHSVDIRTQSFTACDFCDSSFRRVTIQSETHLRCTRKIESILFWDPRSAKDRAFYLPVQNQAVGFSSPIPRLLPSC